MTQSNYKPALHAGWEVPCFVLLGQAAALSIRGDRSKMGSGSIPSCAQLDPGLPAPLSSPCPSPRCQAPCDMLVAGGKRRAGSTKPRCSASLPLGIFASLWPFAYRKSL